MAHTPGPWKVVDRLFIWTDDDVGCEVAQVCDENLDDDMIGQADADARLIAAAPELLAVLERCNNRWDDADEDDNPALGQAIRAAIAKATGKGGE